MIELDNAWIHKAVRISSYDEVYEFVEKLGGRWFVERLYRGTPTRIIKKDGEVVIQDARTLAECRYDKTVLREFQGISDSDFIVNAEEVGGVFYINDAEYVGVDLRNEPLSVRKKALNTLLHSRRVKHVYSFSHSDANGVISSISIVLKLKDTNEALIRRAGDPHFTVSNPVTVIFSYSPQESIIESVKVKMDEISLAKWDRKYINTLPDSAFAYISPGGKKDPTGRTVPRSLRHLPYRDHTGKVDIPHLRNALARLPQTDIPDEAKEQALRVLKKAAISVGVKVSKDE